MEKDIILLTKSSMRSGYCVTGIDLATNTFIRLVTGNNEPLKDMNMQLLNGGIAKPLDLVRVNLIKPVPDKIQSENWLINNDFKWKKIRMADIDEITPYINTNIEYVYKNTNCYLTEEEIININSSLVLLNVNNARLNRQTNMYGKIKSKLSFEFNGRCYNNFSVTDPEFYNIEKAEYKKLLVAVSLPRDSLGAGYYKFVAKIFNIS